MAVVAVHLYNAMERTAQVEWNNVIRFWLCGTVESISQCYEVKQCVHGYYHASVTFFVKRNIMMEYHEVKYQKVPKITIPKGLILGATTTASTHQRNSWTGQMNFSYSFISNSFNSLIVVLYLIGNIWLPALCYTTVADI